MCVAFFKQTHTYMHAFVWAKTENQANSALYILLHWSLPFFFVKFSWSLHCWRWLIMIITATTTTMSIYSILDLLLLTISCKNKSSTNRNTKKWQSCFWLMFSFFGLRFFLPVFSCIPLIHTANTGHYTCTRVYAHTVMDRNAHKCKHARAGYTSLSAK